MEAVRCSGQCGNGKGLISSIGGTGPDLNLVRWHCRGEGSDTARERCRGSGRVPLCHHAGAMSGERLACPSAAAQERCQGSGRRAPLPPRGGDAGGSAGVPACPASAVEVVWTPAPAPGRLRAKAGASNMPAWSPAGPGRMLRHLLNVYFARKEHARCRSGEIHTSSGGNSWTRSGPACGLWRILPGLSQLCF